MKAPGVTSWFPSRGVLNMNGQCGWSHLKRGVQLNCGGTSSVNSVAFLPQRWATCSRCGCNCGMCGVLLSAEVDWSSSGSMLRKVHITVCFDAHFSPANGNRLGKRPRGWLLKCKAPVAQWASFTWIFRGRKWESFNAQGKYISSKDKNRPLPCDWKWWGRIKNLKKKEKKKPGRYSETQRQVFSQNAGRMLEEGGSLAERGGKHP